MGWHYKYLQLLTRRKHKAGISKINNWKALLFPSLCCVKSDSWWRGESLKDIEATYQQHKRWGHTPPRSAEHHRSFHRAGVRLTAFNGSTFAPVQPSGFLTTVTHVSQYCSMGSSGTALKGMPSAEQNAFLLIVTSGYMLSAEIVLDLTSNHFFIALYCINNLLWCKTAHETLNFDSDIHPLKFGGLSTHTDALRFTILLPA